MKALLTLLLSGGAIWNAGWMMLPNDDATEESFEGNELQIVKLEHPPEYVLGFPMYLAVTLKTDESTAFHRLIFPDLFNLRSAIGVEASGGGKEIHVHPKPVIDSTMGRHAQSLMPGESRRMLADVSPLFLDAREGSYQVRFLYTTPEIEVSSKPVELRFRKPTAEEEDLLATMAPDRQKEPTWSRWLLSCPEQSIDANSIKGAGPLAFALAVRYVLCGAQPFKTIDPSVLDSLNGIYAPERDAMEAEIYRARGDSAKADHLKQAVLAKTPGLAWWVDRDTYLSGFSHRPAKEP